MTRLQIGMSRGFTMVTLLLAAIVVFAGCAPKESPTDESSTENASGDAAAAPSGEATQTASADAPLKEGDIVKAAIADASPDVRLGARLFYENRLSNPGANLATSCRSCHIPPAASNDERMWADYTALSVMPANAKGGKLETLRNTPTLLDLDVNTSFDLDGAYTSLKDTVVHELTSEHMGWMADEADRAKDEVFALLLNDTGSDPLAEGSYVDQFKEVKGVNLPEITRDQAFDLVVGSLLEYLATVKTNNSSAYDAFVYLNRLMEGLATENDTPQDLSGRLFGRIANQEGRVLIRFPNVYDEDKYQGYKTFMRVIPTWSSSVEGMEENIGNCIACHVPPKFTDNKFHNIGVSQLEYDAAHGDGAFMKLAFEGPSPKTRARVNPSDPEKVDLGRWNLDPKEENIGAFRTPKLRDPLRTDPYMHNGQYATLEDAIRMHIKAAEMAREGKLRNPDPELMKITGLTEKDVKQLAAFLTTLKEVAPEEFRDYRITNVRIRQDPMGEQTYSN